ncbi:MAG: hypothetical protein IIC80_10910 [Chloroflexi bacterium]|nr:hypothetical protein [Chloroflexota bacterium]
MSGLFTQPRERAPDRLIELPERPDSDFPRWNGQTVVVYDAATREVLYDLGLGSGGSFSRDGSRFVWLGPQGGTEGHDVRVIDLASGVRRVIGRGFFASFASPEGAVVIRGVGGASITVDPVSGEEVETEFDFDIDIADTPVFNLETEFGYFFQQQFPKPGEQPNARTIVFPAGDGKPLSFEGLWLRAVDERTLAAVVASKDKRSMNIFVIDLVDASATFLGTGGTPMPVVGRSSGAAWVVRECTRTARGRFFDYETRELLGFDRSIKVTRVEGDRMLVSTLNQSRPDAVLDRQTASPAAPQVVMPTLPVVATS